MNKNDFFTLLHTLNKQELQTLRDILNGITKEDSSDIKEDYDSLIRDKQETMTVKSPSTAYGVEKKRNSYTFDEINRLKQDILYLKNELEALVKKMNVLTGFQSKNRQREISPIKGITAALDQFRKLTALNRSKNITIDKNIDINSVINELNEHDIL